MFKYSHYVESGGAFPDKVPVEGLDKIERLMISHALRREAGLCHVTGCHTCRSLRELADRIEITPKPPVSPVQPSSY